MKFKECEMCPNNGFCDEEGELNCDRGYIKEAGICVENLVVL